MSTMPKNVDCLIIGGGIVGCGVYRELASHGLSTLLIEKFDFCSQTSAASSKMLHGGIRYLENFDFPLVYEALHEKNLWLEKVPHLAKEKSFLLPVYNDSLRPLWMVNLGLWLYDLLSGFKNSPHSTMSQAQVVQTLKGVQKQNLTGAGVYYDSVVDDVKLGLELIYDVSDLANAYAFNYHEVTNIELLQSDGYKVTIKNNLENTLLEVECSELIFTTGPFTDQLLGQFDFINWKPKMVPSKGSHLWLKKEKFQFEESVVLTPNDGRVIFVIPYSEKVLVGTTEVPLKTSEFNLTINQEEQEYLLRNLNEFFPDIKIDNDDIISAFAGIRPLVKDGHGENVAKVARNHKYFQPRSNLHVMIGGKYTTFRIMAKDLAKIILEKYKMTYEEKYSIRTPRQKSTFPPFEKQLNLSKEKVLKCLDTEYVCTLDDLLKRRMGVFSRSHWNFQEDFETFFKENKDAFAKKIKISDCDIENF